MKLRNKKTGEITDGYIQTRTYGKFEVVDKNNLEAKYEYNTLSELNEDWEDYRPAEPLIKDEKIRKAVRAWAESLELNPKDRIIYVAGKSGLEEPNGAVIYFEKTILDPSKIENGRHYSIEELCGEEEEPRAVIADGLKYHSYEDYLKSKDEE